MPPNLHLSIPRRNPLGLSLVEKYQVPKYQVPNVTQRVTPTEPVTRAVDTLWSCTIVIASRHW